MNKQYINRMTGMGAWFVAFLFFMPANGMGASNGERAEGYRGNVGYRLCV